MEYRLERDDRGPLCFNGEQISYVSTQTRTKERWTELGVYRIDSDESPARWVVEAIGRSTVEGERDYHTVTMCSTPEDVAAALSKRGRLSGPGLDAIEYAADKDDELDVYLERIFEDEVIS